jgi:hypothetical protein
MFPPDCSKCGGYYPGNPNAYLWDVLEGMAGDKDYIGTCDGDFLGGFKTLEEAKEFLK